MVYFILLLYCIGYALQKNLKVFTVDISVSFPELDTWGDIQYVSPLSSMLILVGRDANILYQCREPAYAYFVDC